MHIELRHIHKRFGPIHANNDISLTFRSGRIVGILGENGAGKSTLMKILSGFQSLDSGEIWLDGRRVIYRDPQAAIAHGIGMLQQDPLDVGAFTVLENFMYGQPGGLLTRRAAALAALAEISQRFGFELDADAPIAQLSIGQRQQLEIVRLLALGVRTLILDEPTTGISAEQKTILFNTLRVLAETNQMTILLVSHKLEDVIALCHEVAVLRAGRLVGTLDMPATTGQLVTLMFGQELAPQTRQAVRRSEAWATPTRADARIDGAQTGLAAPNVHAAEGRADLRPEAAHIEAAQPVLSLENVRLQGKRVVVENLSLQVRPGEVIGLAGLDGSGQELLLRACVGLEFPQAGRIVVCGEDMTSHRRPTARRGRLLSQATDGLSILLRWVGGPLQLVIDWLVFFVRLAFVNQSDQSYRRFMRRGVAFSAAGRLEEGLVRGLTLTEHMALVTESGPLVDWPRARQRTEAQLKQYDVRGHPDSPVETLSGGNQQRMLMALMPQQPALMALENPTRGLDVDSARWIWQQLLARRDDGAAILFSSPDLDELVTYSDRILVFFAGRVHEIPDAGQTTIDELGRLIGGHFEVRP